MLNRLLNRLLVESQDKYVVPYLSLCTRLVLRAHKPKIIAITGTVGKTTLTEMLGWVLMQDSAQPFVGRVWCTRENMNGDYGLRLTVLQRRRLPNRPIRRLVILVTIPFRAVWLALSMRYPQLLVLEYGTYARGHLHDLAKDAPPTIAIVTTIGPAHLDRHKTVEGVYNEKRAVTMAAPPNGLVVLGAGHEFVGRLTRDAKAPVVIVDGRGAELSRNITRVVCRHLGVPEEITEAGLRSYVPPESRLTRRESGGACVIDDSYNANPISMKLALDILAAEKGRRRVAVLGAMAELGDQSCRYHEDIGAYAKSRADLIVGVGEDARAYHPDKWYSDSQLCAERTNDFIEPGDVVLVKGSHAAKMSRVVQSLLRLEAASGRVE